MATPITLANLQAVVDRINRQTGSPMTTCDRVLDAPLSGPAKDKGETRPYSFRWNIGNYHLSQQYGGVALHRVDGDKGGIRDVLRIGHVPKRELYNAMHAFLSGLDASKAA